MNAMDLLVGFGSVKDSYVIGTEEFETEITDQAAVNTKGIVDCGFDCINYAVGWMCRGLCQWMVSAGFLITK